MATTNITKNLDTGELQDKIKEKLIQTHLGNDTM